MRLDDEVQWRKLRMSVGSMSTIERETLPAPSAEHHLPATLIPNAIRCHHCFALSHIDVEQRRTGGDIAVRYVCPDCNAYSIRHFHESER